MSDRAETISSLVFVGTQSCMPSPDRSTSCTAVVLDPGAEVVLVDCGEGTQREMMRAKALGHSARLGRVSRVLLTHLHGDHCFGLPGLMCTVAQLLGADAASATLEVVGPPGTARYVRDTLDVTASYLSCPYRVVELHGAWRAGGSGVSMPEGRAQRTPGQMDEGDDGCGVVDGAEGDDENTRESVRIAAREEARARDFEGPYHPCEVPPLLVEVGEDGSWTIPAKLRRSDVPPEYEFVGEVAAAEVEEEGEDFEAGQPESACAQDAKAASSSSRAAAKPAPPSKTPMTLYAAPIAHRVPCVGYLFAEADRTTIDAALAESLGVPRGPMLGVIRSKGSVDTGTRTVTLAEISRVSRGKRVAVLGDCSAVSGAMMRLMDRCSVLVHEATYGEDMAERAPQHGHSTAATAGRVAAACGAERLVLNHFSARYAGSAALATLRDEAVASGYKGPVTAAEDGMHVPLKK
jgi:ribonuclease BN (tRNA processing enzyme)